MSAIQTQNLMIQFGGLKAVCDLNLDIKQNSIFGLIGPNGAGKTTVFNLLTGVYQPTSGSITAFGKSIVGLTASEITKKGLARTFQNIRLFKSLPVLDNLLVAMDAHPEVARAGVWASLFKTKRSEECEKARIEKAIELLKIFNLHTHTETLACNLPYGDQRRLEIARALATGAKVLLLDEPAAGLNPLETARLMDTIKQIRDHFKVTIVLIEHDMKLVMGICERIAVLDYGIKIAEGNASEIRANPKVIEAYLGKAHDGANP